MTASKDKLLPCPFCGNERINSDGLAHSRRGVMFCDKCGSFGPNPVYDEAYVDWNTRAQLTDSPMVSATAMIDYSITKSEAQLSKRCIGIAQAHTDETEAESMRDLLTVLRSQDGGS